MKKILSLLLSFTLMASLFVGCGTTNSIDDATEKDGITSSMDEAEEEIAKTDEELFTERDANADYSETDSVRIELKGSSAIASSDSVKISGSTVTITEEATYIISGTLTDGMIIVDADENAKLQIVLNGVNVASDTSAALYILEADKVFVTLADGTSNTFANGGTFTAVDDNNVDGAVFSKQDLTFNGSGNLTVTSPAGHGIVCKDDLVFTGGTYTVNSASHGLDANDSVRITGETQLTIAAGRDGIHCENTEDESLGFIYISNGTFEIAVGDDAIHAEESLSITGGLFNITESYEGLEALDIDIRGGEFKIVASDDGLNAAGGTDSSGFAGASDDMFGGGHGGRPGGGHGGVPGGMGGGMSSGNGSIVISGGNLYVKASGDGIDANGTLTISGGYIVVTGPTQGDTATLDYDRSATITGGTFIGTGASGMAQTFSDSEQGVIAVSVGNQSAGTNVTLTDKSGNIVLSYEPELSFAVVILSSPDIKSGETYTITVGTTSGEFEAS